MTHLANRTGRAYRSELRAEQADATRTRILEATGRVTASGIASLSIPAIAREAGVSVPTVYRHFATKTDLLAAVYPHILRRAGLEELAPPRSLGELKAGLRALIERTDSFDELTRAALASPAAEEVRRLSMPARLAWARQLVDSAVAPWPDVEADRVARLLVVLTSSSALRTWREQLGASVDETADDIDWVVRAAISAARTRSRA